MAHEQPNTIDAYEAGEDARKDNETVYPMAVWDHTSNPFHQDDPQHVAWLEGFSGVSHGYIAAMLVRAAQK